MRAEGAVALLLLVGCASDAPPPEPTVGDGGWTLGPEVLCDAPVDPFASLRAVDDRGVDVPIPDAEQFGVPGHYLVSTVVRDLDGDGDIDLAFSRPDSGVDVYVNDGTGRFAWLGEDLPWTAVAGAPARDALANAFVDVDGDALPDLVRSGWDGVWIHRNLGGLEFGPAEWLWDGRGGPWEGAAWATFGMGDLDADGDMDLVLSSLHGPHDFDGEPPPGFTDLVVLMEDGAVAAEIPISDRGPGNSQLALLTDRDGDGDLDVYIGADLKIPGAYPPGTFWRNDGVDGAGALQLVDDGDETASALQISHMGAASADMNGDGLLDYCFSVIGPVVCIESDPSGAYVDTSAVHGLTPALVKIRRYWTGWSLELADLDNDGSEDMIVAGGRSDDFLGDDIDSGPNGRGDGPPPVDTPWVTPQPNAIWQGLTDRGWVERTEALGFGSTREAFGMATGDLNGDGTLEVVIGNETGLPSIWDAGCTADAWLEFDLIGPGGTRDLVGAQVFVEDGDRSWLREVQSLRTVGQGPARLHVGLGDRDTVDSVTVRWPGGETSVAEGVPTRRLIRVEAP